MRYLLCLLLLVSLAGCSDGDDLHEYVARVRAKPLAPIEPLPQIHPFEAMPFSPAKSRSPFSVPRPEGMFPQTLGKRRDCVQPDPSRKKDELEQFSLDNMTMRGTMEGGGRRWALIHTPTGVVHRVGVGRYMGLNQGRVLRVDANGVELQEWIADGKGCWVTRAARLGMPATQ